MRLFFRCDVIGCCGWTSARSGSEILVFARVILEESYSLYKTSKECIVLRQCRIIENGSGENCGAGEFEVVSAASGPHPSGRHRYRILL